MRKIVLIMAFHLWLLNVYSQGTAVNDRTAQYNVAANKLGIEGYDPVAYFEEGKAVKGKPEFSVVYEGIKYQFSGSGHLDLFKKQPARYEPQYGGWCAYAMGSDGSKVDVDPETFKIADGKLFLFYNKFFTNTLKSWNKNEVALKKKADANWPKFYHP
ncbi:MAG: YHS domain-containing (seleno)protein [Flavitalea sp.]